MSIKQSMMMILLFLGVSFSAYAGVSASSKSAPFHGQPFSDVSSYFAALDNCFNYYGWRRKSDASVQTNSSSGNQYVLMSTTVYHDNACTRTNGTNRAKTIGFYTNISCNPPKEFNELGKCEEPPEPQCPEGQIEGIEGDCMCKDGSKPNFLGVCEDYCNSDEFNALKREKIILCNNQYGDFSYTCNGRDDVTFECKPRDDDNDSGSDNGGGSSSGGDSGGSSSGGTGGDNTPDPQPDSGIADVAKAIDSMKTDSNTRLDRLADKVESLKTATDTASTTNSDRLDKVKKSIDDFKAAGDANSKANIAAIGKVQTAVGDLSGKIGDLNTSIGDVETGVNKLNDSLTDVNAAVVGVNVCQNNNCTSFYEAKYPDGVGGVVSHRFGQMSAVVTSGIANTFSVIDMGSSSRPDYAISLNFGFADYGSFDIAQYAHLNTVFTFLRVFFMACCLFYCRSLIFGG